MAERFVLSRALKSELKRRVAELTRMYNAAASDANAICDLTVPFTAEKDIRQGETVFVRVPKRFTVRNT